MTNKIQTNENIWQADKCAMRLRSCMAGCFFGAPFCAAQWPLWRLLGDSRRVGVATKSPRSSQKQRKGRTADDLEPSRTLQGPPPSPLPHDRSPPLRCPTAAVSRPLPVGLIPHRVDSRKQCSLLAENTLLNRSWIIPPRFYHGWMSPPSHYAQHLNHSCRCS